jgi:hypothetical protein
MIAEQATFEVDLPRFLGPKSTRVNGVLQEIIRRARCPLHHRISSDYAGENEHGWIFRCGGFTPGQVKSYYRKNPDSRDQIVAGIWHFFVARGAK